MRRKTKIVLAITFMVAVLVHGVFLYLHLGIAAPARDHGA